MLGTVDVTLYAFLNDGTATHQIDSLTHEINAKCVSQVALNLQTPGRPVYHNEGKFRDNGGCGYLLKPPQLLDSNGFDAGAFVNTEHRVYRLIVTVRAHSSIHSDRLSLSHKRPTKGIECPTTAQEPSTKLELDRRSVRDVDRDRHSV